jgi:16S rRNA (guanine966-N2)-methyltransferase
LAPREKARAPAAPKGANRLRIIAGRWRGRRIPFPDAPGLRPTPDRVRETVFNWLAPWLAGARCLDLFAGSGALGLEALSRGAASAVFVDQDPRVVAALEDNLRRLEASGAQVVQADAVSYLAGRGAAFDVVFLDPPFHGGLLGRCCELLDRGGWVGPGALVYLEAERDLEPLVLPAGWELVRSKTAGQVGYHLAKITTTGAGGGDE